MLTWSGLVQLPGVAIFEPSVVALGPLSQLSSRILAKVLKNPRGAPAEVFLEPVVNARDAELPVPEARPARMVHVGNGALREQAVEVLGGVRHSCKVRAAQARAVQCVMEPRVLPDRAEDAVLDVVQAEPFALHRDELDVPWTNTQKVGLDASDRLDRVVVQDPLHRQHVVQVDPEGPMLPPVVARDECGLKTTEVLLEGPPVVGPHGLVVHSVDA